MSSVIRILKFLRYPFSSALFLVLAFPPFDLWPFAGLALVPLLRQMTAIGRPRTAFFAGWLTGWLFSLGLLHWLPAATISYGKVHPLLAGLLYAGAAAVTGFYCALFALAMFLLFRRFGWRAFLLTPPVWVACELTRSWMGGLSFPWGLSGNTLIWLGPLLQIADVTGVYGVSALVALINSVFLLALSPEADSRLKRWWAALAGMALLYCLIYGEFRYRSFPAEEGKPLVVAGLQAHIRNEQSWSEVAAAHSKVYPRMLAEEKARQPELSLAILPESPAAYIWDKNPGYRDLMHQLAREQGLAILFNGIHQDRAGGYTNAVYFIDPEKTGEIRYDKIRLVPFAEYVPFAALLPFARSLSQEVGTFRPGRELVMPSRSGVVTGGSVCFEAIFPGFCREFTANGANLLVNVSNDTWFGATASRQHFQHSILRAVENRRWLVRVANSGISAIIDPLGRIRHAAPVFQPGVLSGTVYPQTHLSFYVRCGDLFAYGCVAVVGFFLILAFRRKVQDGSAG